MKSESKAAIGERPGGALYGLYMVALAVCLLGNLLVRVGMQGGWLTGGAQLALAAVAVLPLVAVAVLFWRLLQRDLDEMLQRIVLEGMAFALIVYIPLAALYVNLRTAGARLPRLDPPELVLAPALLMAVGVAIARRRYE